MDRLTQPVYDEKVLLLRVTSLEDEIERLEAAKSRLSQRGRTDVHLGIELRRLRRERATCLSVLLS